MTGRRHCYYYYYSLVPFGANRTNFTPSSVHFRSSILGVQSALYCPYAEKCNRIVFLVGVGQYIGVVVLISVVVCILIRYCYVGYGVSRG